MSINAYIDSLTKITPKKSVENVRWYKVSEGNKKKETKQRVPQGRGISPGFLNLEQADEKTFSQRDQKNHKGQKTKSSTNYYDSESTFDDRYRFADIVSSVREVGSGYNTFSNHAIEKRYRQKPIENSSLDRSDSSTAYITATSKSTEESFKSAEENLGSLKLTSDESDNGLWTSDKNEEECKKNFPIAEAQHTAFSNTDRLTKNSLDYDSTQDLEKDDSWNEIETDESMYNGRIIRFFQSTEDEDVYVHPLKEQVQKDPKWQQFQLRRKVIESHETARQFYFNLDDEAFEFQQPKSSA